MAAEPEFNRLAREFRERNPALADVDFDTPDLASYLPWAPPIFSEGVLERRFRLTRMKLAARVAPEPNEFQVPALQLAQKYHGNRARELEVLVDDLSCEPETILTGARAWLAVRLRERHLQRAGDATQQLDAMQPVD